MNLVTLVQHSTQYYLFDTQQGKLMFDCGWPGELAHFKEIARRAGIKLSEIKLILCSHYHMDHAGLVQDFKNMGATLILMESQIGAPQTLNEYMLKKNIPMTPIKDEDHVLLKFSESRAWLAKLGLAGEIISTPGHGADHVTLILDDGSAFTGDLPPRFLVTEDQTDAIEAWNRIHEHPIARIYPSHGPRHEMYPNYNQESA
ncbi:MAG: hypothetical protein HFACDABA_03115 [Anaerolineales bacterium]|nr:hypothetical protein [Anaerolineales bacterium]